MSKLYVTRYIQGADTSNSAASNNNEQNLGLLKLPLVLGDCIKFYLPNNLEMQAIVLEFNVKKTSVKVRYHDGAFAWQKIENLQYVTVSQSLPIQDLCFIDEKDGISYIVKSTSKEVFKIDMNEQKNTATTVIPKHSSSSLAGVLSPIKQTSSISLANLNNTSSTANALAQTKSAKQILFPATSSSADDKNSNSHSATKRVAELTFARKKQKPAQDFTSVVNNFEDSVTQAISSIEKIKPATDAILTNLEQAMSSYKIIYEQAGTEGVQQFISQNPQLFPDDFNNTLSKFFNSSVDHIQHIQSYLDSINEIAPAFKVYFAAKSNANDASNPVHKNTM
jgi:hypothetical protein